MKKKSILFFSICSIFFICMIVVLSTYNRKNYITHADFPYFNDTDSLVENADTIIDGKVIKEEGVKTININLSDNPEEDLYAKYTVFQVEVLDVIKGDIKVGDIIEIKQLGDKNGIKNEETEEAGYYAENQECVFFLVSYKNVNPDMPYSTLNPSQGSITFIDNKSQVVSENKLISNNINKDKIITDLKDRVEKHK